jgi:hypothetical protein
MKVQLLPFCCLHPDGVVDVMSLFALWRSPLYVHQQLNYNHFYLGCGVVKINSFTQRKKANNGIKNRQLYSEDNRRREEGEPKKLEEQAKRTERLPEQHSNNTQITTEENVYRRCCWYFYELEISADFRASTIICIVLKISSFA